MDGRNTIVTIKTGHLKLSPSGFLRYASHFYIAAKSFERPEGFSPVPYYLYCRCIELALKAFLLAKDVPKHKLKHKIGHNLLEALKMAANLGIHAIVLLTDDQAKEIEKANNYYSAKGFEYFEVHDAIRGHPDLPDLEILDHICRQLTEQLHDFCWVG